MDRGYVKFWRKMKDSDLMQNHEALALWTWVILSANFKPTSICSKGVRLDLGEGQLLYGRARVSKKLGLSERKMRTALAYLVHTDRVTSRTTNRGTILTVVNWALYQSAEDSGRPAERPTRDQQATSRRPAGDHSKEGKKVKNDKKREEDSPAFDAWWAVYPRKVDKKPAHVAYDKAVPKVGDGKLYEMVELYRTATATWKAEDRKYIPHPATWLNQERYHDDPSEWVDEKERSTQQERKNRQLADEESAKRSADEKALIEEMKTPEYQRIKRESFAKYKQRVKA